MDYQFQKTENIKKTIHHVAFRIKYSQIQDHNRFKKFLHSYKNFFVVSENEQTNHHLQGVVTIPTKPVLPKSAIDTFRVKFKALGWFSGNKDYSLKLGDGSEKYLRYLCKGESSTKPPIIYINNFLLEEKINVLHNEYYIENKKYKTTDAHKKYAKIIQIKIPEKYKNACSLVKVIMQIIMYHDQNNLLIPDDYSLKKMARTYLFKTLDDNHKWDRANSIASKLAYDSS